MRLVGRNIIRFVPDAFKQSTFHNSFCMEGIIPWYDPSCGAGIIEDLCDHKETTVTKNLKINFDHVF